MTRLTRRFHWAAAVAVATLSFGGNAIAAETAPTSAWTDCPTEPSRLDAIGSLRGSTSSAIGATNGSTAGASASTTDSTNAAIAGWIERSGVRNASADPPTAKRGDSVDQHPNHLVGAAASAVFAAFAESAVSLEPRSPLSVTICRNWSKDAS